MRIDRLRLTDYRGIDHAEVRFAPSGVTIVEGDNEVGKTSLTEALDLVLTVRDDSKKEAIRSLQPYGRDVGPEVEVELTTGAHRFVLRKRWLRRPETVLEVLEPEREVLTGREEGQEYSLADAWSRPAAPGTVAAFERRLHAAAKHVAHLIRGKDVGKREAHLLDWRRKQVSVVDIHALHDRAKRFVVGAVLKRMFEEKESLGTSRPLVFVVLDELNKYAPRDGGSAIKEVLLDISERGRSLGIVLLGAQQTASEVEGRIVQNAALRVVGRLDPAEAERAEYGFLTAAARGRASILKPGTMIVMQPEIPTPLLVRFPFPAWATRKSEVAEAAAADPFAGFRDR